MIINKIQFSPLYKHDELKLIIPKGQHNEALKFIGNKKGKEYTLEIKQKRKKRSIDANAYFWVLCKKIAEKLNHSETEVYQKIITECGVYNTLVISDDAISKFKKAWESNGIGWLCLTQGSCRTQQGYSYIRTYIGSSQYDQAEMSRLIDSIVTECKELGIETMTPNEIEKLKMQWDC